MLRPFFIALLCFAHIASVLAQADPRVNAATATEPNGRWTRERAHAWYARQPWMTGANFVPSTAINQLEMWQAATFDTATIARELGWAEDIGFNTMRVYLHSLAYDADPVGFKQRVNQYLAIAERHGIRTILTLFDDVWRPDPALGVQLSPKPGTHNSGWVQDPGWPASKDPAEFPRLEAYVKDIVSTFAQDERVVFWDLYNEPGNSGKGNASMPLLEAVFAWGRAVNPSQPLTVGVWNWSLHELNAYQIQHSDIINYHDYESPDWHRRVIEMLMMHDRPMVCTEYMARTNNSRFANTLPMLKRHNIGAINWGLVAGKSNTIYAWDTPIDSGEEPAEWFHDVFRADGTPYRRDEVELIAKLNREARAATEPYRGLDPADFLQSLDGRTVKLYWIKRPNFEAAFTNYGGRLVSLWVPDKTGKMTDVIAGPGSTQGFINSTEPYFGATIGRVGNRIANGRFSLDGKTYQTPTNDGPHTLHSGGQGFERVIWEAELLGDTAIAFSHVSRDGDQGFPGRLNVTVTYSLTTDRALQIDYAATTDQPTVVNLTNHAFFNLNGEGSGDILNHRLRVNATRYTPVDAGLIPTGKFESVKNTPFDFTTPRTIGERIGASNAQLGFGKGYDHNFVLDVASLPGAPPRGSGLHAAATVTGDRSGITMTLTTTEPGLQFYSGNFMQGKNRFKSGARDDFRTAFALETHHFPDAPNQLGFPSITLLPGEKYASKSEYKFSVE